MRPVPEMTRPELTGHPVALFVFSNLRDQKGGLTQAWLRRLELFDAAGWDTHVATIHLQPEIEETLAAWRERGLLPQRTLVHHYQRRNRRFRASWSRPTDETFTRDDRVADWLDWLVGCIPGVVVFADSPVTYAPVAMMRNPYVGRIMTVHLAHRHTQRPKKRLPAGSSPPVPPEARSPEVGEPSSSAATGVGDDRGAGRPAKVRSRYRGVAGRPKLTDRFLPFAHGADVVVAPTRRQAEHLREDLPGTDVRTIPNIVDPVPSGSGGTRDRHLVVQLGRLDPVKRVDHSLRAVQIAHGSVPELRLDVYGRGPEMERLQALSHELGLDGVVTFRGFTDQPAKVLAGAAASILTSRREGFGLAVAESLAAGTPVISYDVEYGPAELVVDGVNGRLVRDGSVRGLAEALVQVLTDEAGLARMSESAPEATAALAGAVVGRQWITLAEEVAGRVEPPDGVLLVEDLRIRRRGLVVAGVALGGRAEAMPARLELPGIVTLPLEATPLAQAGGDVADGAEESGPEQEDDSGWSQPSGHQQVGGLSAEGAMRANGVDAVLAWPDVAAWPDSAVLGATTALGRQVPVIGPGVPQTVAPTELGVVILGADETWAIGRLASSDPVELEFQPTDVRATIGEDTTILTEGVRLLGRLLDGRARTLSLEIDVDQPGLLIAEDAALTIAARIGERLLPIGTARVLAGTGAWSALDPAGRARWSCRATVEWDPDPLAGSGPSTALLALAVGRRLRQLGPVDFPGGRPVGVPFGGRWVLAASRTGRAMLVPGRGARIRAAWLVRKLLG